MIDFVNVNKVFENENREDIKDINIKIDKGDIFGFVGKDSLETATLLKMINLLEEPTKGRILVDKVDVLGLNDRNLNTIRKRIGMVFKNENIIESKTVYENLQIPLILERFPIEEMRERIYKSLDFVNLSDKACEYPFNLSYEEKYRIAIARAIVAKPLVLLCEDITGKFDNEFTRSTLNILKRIHRETNVTIVLSTNKIMVAKTMCNKLAIIEKGKIEEIGSISEIVSNPKSKIYCLERMDIKCS